MDDDWCCKGTDPSCDGPQECANRAALLIEAQQDEIERLHEKVEDLSMYLERDACEIERLQALINAVSDLHDFDHTDNPRCTQCGEWPCSTHLVVCGECTWLT